MDRLRPVLSDFDLDGLLLYSDGIQSIDRPSALQHFTGVTPVADNNCLVVPANHENVFLIDVPHDVERVRSHAPIGDVRATRTFDEAIPDLLDELAIEASIGVAGVDRMPVSTYRTIGASVRNVVPVDEAVDELAWDKDERTLRTFRELGRIADVGFRTAFELLRPGIKEYELAAEIEGAMRQAGAEDNFNLLSTGGHNRMMHAPTDRILRDGDIVLFEISPAVDGLVTQICRTVSVGTPSTTLVEKYGLLREALDRTKPKLLPGNSASIIAARMNEVFRNAGYAEYCKPPYMRTRGHEFGIGPIGMAIDEETETPLAEGMVLVVHPNQYIPETGYLSLGDPVEITPEGFEPLTDIDARLFTKDVI